VRAIDGLREISTILRGYGIEESQKEAEIILTDFTGVERVAFYRDNPVLSLVQWEAITRVIGRRHEREPLQYILGYVDFCGLKIRVGPGVLIPRPETELVVEEAIKTVVGGQSTVGSQRSPEERILSDSGLSTGGGRLKILDLCTGSGCLALSLAKQFGKAEVFGTDVSEKSLEYAVENAGINGIKNVAFLKGDLYEPVKDRRFDIIVSNPPYIKRAEIPSLSPEIRLWEPVEALDGGKDGLEFYRRILSRSADYLAGHGSLIVELGYGEVRDVMKIAEKSGLRLVSLVRDYSGIERVLCLALQ
jgi:release factor glutamine methyltransferase